MELTPAVIKRASGHFDVSCVTHLDLSRANIGRLAHLDGCVNLVQLSLASNALAAVSGLPSIATLQRLDLSSNKIASLDDLPSLPDLEELVVAHNCIAAINVNVLARKLPRLRALSLEANPLTDDSDFSASDFVKKLRAAFPELMLFNGEMVALAQLSQASHAATSTGKDSRQSATLRDEESVAALPAFDVQRFIQQETQRLEAMLAQCERTVAASTHVSTS